MFIGIDRVGKSFIVAFALLKSEDHNNFCWALERLKECLGGSAMLTMISDNDGAFFLAVSESLPEVDHQLCTWHMFKRVVLNFKKRSSNEAEYETAIAAVKALLYCKYVLDW
jgi:transposase-like protein